MVQPTIAGIVEESESAKDDFVEILGEEEIEEFLIYQNNIPAALADLMKEGSVVEKQIRRAVADRGYYPFNTPIGKYDPEFVEKVLIEAWPQVLAMIKEQQ